MARESKQGRARMILEHLNAYGPALTELQLAKLQGVKKTPHFLSIIESLVNNQYVVVQWARGSNRQLTRYYSLPEQVVRMEGF